MNKILSSSIKQVSQKKSKDRLQSSEICKAAIKLTSAIKPLNAYITVTSELAKKQAQDADERQSSGKSLGCLDGIPIAIKDNFCTNGQPTTCASQMLANFVPTYDATVYSRLKNSGAVLIGKTNLDQFAMGSGTIDSYYGPTKNIWGSDLMKNYTCESGKPITRNELPPQKDNWYIAGGSSGGSAIAVATGTCYAALGSDTGGSTRNPAAYCGLIGLKPTYGLVSRHGLIPLVNSMDVPGIITRTVDDAVLVLNAVAGPDPLDSTTLRNEFKPVKLRKYSSLRGIRIGIPMEYYTSEINLEVESCCLRLTQDLEEAGATIVLVSLPHTDYSIVCYSVLNQCEVASNMARYDGIEYGLRVDEMTSVKELYAKTRSQGFNDVVRSRILAGNFFLLSDNYDDYFIKAMKIRRLISQDFDAVWDSNIDLLLTPTTLSEIPLYSEYISADNQTQCSVYDYCTQPANMAGIPAVNVPVMLSKKGLPLSVQLMAPFLHEDRLLTVAKWIEEIVEFPRLTLKDASLLE